MVYQFDPNMLPDAAFHPGELRDVVPGNEGRLLDERRTPLRLLEVKRASGQVVVELLAFEDRGATWELPLEKIDRMQFANGGARASAAEVAEYRAIIARLDHPLEIPADPVRRAETEDRIAELRAEAGTWLERESSFLRSGRTPDFTARTGDAGLQGDLERFMRARALWDLEDAFAEQYVRNPHSGERVKGHRIVLAEVGLVAFQGTRVRDDGLFDGAWSKRRRADHVLHRLAFVRALFGRLGRSTVVVFRGLSCDARPGPRENRSFVSATFSLDVAMSHFHGRDPARTGILLRQSVPVERLFMSYLETARMNQQYREAEAVLLDDPANEVF